MNILYHYIYFNCKITINGINYCDHEQILVSTKVLICEYSNIVRKIADGDNQDISYAFGFATEKHNHLQFEWLCLMSILHYTTNSSRTTNTDCSDINENSNNCSTTISSFNSIFVILPKLW